jgi:uncharacterized MAPEG superfamily protein
MRTHSPCDECEPVMVSVNNCLTARKRGAALRWRPFLPALARQTCDSGWLETAVLAIGSNRHGRRGVRSWPIAAVSASFCVGRHFKWFARMRPLSVEVIGLLAGVGLGVLHIVLASHAASFRRGYRWSAGPRDELLPPLTGIAGRLARACSNYLETFPFFAALTLAVIATNSHCVWSTWGVCLYLAGRAAYLPLYAFGVYLVRSLAWNVALAGVVLLGLALVIEPAGSTG